MGYFPCPPQAIDQLLSMLTRSEDQHLSILDPCAGGGAAVQQLAQGLKIPEEDVYCIELDEGRGQEIRERMPRANVLAPASFLGTAVRARAFSLVYCNPPFDHAIGGKLRCETQFLMRATPHIVDGGILVGVWPENVGDLPEVYNYMHHWYDEVNVIPFKSEYRKYREVFTIGIKRGDIYPEQVRAEEDCYHSWKKSWRVPQSKGPCGIFSKTQLTPLEMEIALRDSPLRRYLKSMPPPPVPSPPLSLGAGHIALLLASGTLDGLVKEPGGGRHVVRGTARKEEVETDKSKATEGKKKTTKTVLTEKIKLTVRTIDQSGTLKTLE